MQYFIFDAASQLSCLSHHLCSVVSVQIQFNEVQGWYRMRCYRIAVVFD